MCLSKQALKINTMKLQISINIGVIFYENLIIVRLKNNIYNYKIYLN